MLLASKVVSDDLLYMESNLRNELNLLSGKRVLITGGGGFLGYYLIKLLIYWNNLNSTKSPIEILVIDNFSRGLPDWIREIQTNNLVKVITHDISESLPELIGEVHYFIHAASIASPTFYRKFPVQTMDANVNGLRNLLDYCLKLKSQGFQIRGILYFSTSEIYGDPTEGNIPTPENYRGFVSCTGPRACYDESKRFGETLCVNFQQEYKLPIKIARPFNNYGPGLKITDKRVIPDFSSNILNNENIILFSDGSPTRTYCYISDAIVGYYKCLINGIDGEPYNIGTEKPEISIIDLAKFYSSIAKDLIGYTGDVIHGENSDPNYLIDNPNRRCPDITKAKNHLGFNPMVTLEEGLRKTLTWYLAHRTAAEA
jgi:UDP-glucuronate decarboxylase